MELYSLQFAVLLVVALGAYYAVGRYAKRGQWVVLLATSLVFYFLCGWQNLFFIVFTAASVWAVGLVFARFEARSSQERAALSDRAQKKAVKKAWNHKKWIVLLAALVVNFGILAYIKYWNALLATVGAGDSFLASHLLLPLGISFYTFQSAGYLIDVYNGKYEPERNFARFLLFVSWFPQLIQGPINRFDALAQQLYDSHSFDVQNARRALLLIGYGALKKFAIADLTVTAVSKILGNVSPSMPGSVIVFGILLYSIQQYTDFSGGIDMVRGVSQLFGVDMARNFRQPYFSISLADFWRRWHITLGAWMRDYVFYPAALRPSMRRLGEWAGSHFGKHIGRSLPACLANILVFFLVGLWHGAEAHFILWGLYNGIVIAAADLLAPIFARMRTTLKVDAESRAYHVFRIIRTFIVVNIGWYFDRIYDFGSCLQGFYNTIFRFDLGMFYSYIHSLGISHLKAVLVMVVIGCLIVFIISVLQERGIDCIGRILALNVVVRFALYAVIVLLILFSFAFGFTGGGFIYANF